MSAISLESKADILQILRENNADPRDCGDYLQCRATFRGGDGMSCALYLKDDKAKDFVTNRVYSIADFLQLFTGKEYNIESARESVYIPELDVIEVKKYYDKAFLDDLDSDYSYWNKRGISSELLAKFKGGVCKREGKMRGRFVFPIFDVKGNIEAVSGRAVYEADKLTKEQQENFKKWKHIGPVADTSYPLFLNEKIIKKTQTIVICESIGDCLSLMMAGIYNVLVAFGLNLGDGILNSCIRYDVNKVVIALNNDKNLRGNRAAQKMKWKLCKYFDEEQVVIALPPEMGVDFNEMTIRARNEYKKKYNL